MIVAAISRQTSTAQRGWEYQDFPDMEYFLDWVADRAAGPVGIEHVYEFMGGKPHPVENWENQLAELRQSAEDDRRHTARWSHPGPL